MAKLSLNKAAAHAGKAKADILKALKSNDPLKKLSGEKNEKGHWEIDTAELDRVFGQKSTNIATRSNELVPTIDQNRSATPESFNPTSALQTEVKMLREQMAQVETMHERERELLANQIEDLKSEAERRSAEHMKALAMLTDQREQKPKRGLWARLVG